MADKIPERALLQVFKERDIMAVAAVIEGLQFMLEDARRGDPGARGTLDALAKVLADIQHRDSWESPLTVVRTPR